MCSQKSGSMTSPALGYLRARAIERAREACVAAKGDLFVFNWHQYHPNDTLLTVSETGTRSALQWILLGHPVSADNESELAFRVVFPVQLMFRNYIQNSRSKSKNPPNTPFSPCLFCVSGPRDFDLAVRRTYWRRSSSARQELRDHTAIQNQTMTNAKALSPLQCCSVCLVSEKVSRNFGATTCSPCAAFFRRTVALKIRYVCKYSNDCSVAREIRNGCRSCRFQKCETVGMKKQLVQSKGEKHERLPEYIRKGRENGSEEVVRGFATSIFFARSESKSGSECVSPTPSINSTSSSIDSSVASICPILDVTPDELLNYYVAHVRDSISQWNDALDMDSVEHFIQAKYIGDQNAWLLCSNCPGVDLLTEDEVPTLLRYCSFSNVWMNSAWMRTTEGKNYVKELVANDSEPLSRMSPTEMVSSEMKDSSGSLQTLISHFHSSVSTAVSRLQLDLVEYSALKAMCIWKLGLVDFTLTLKIVAQEQYYGLTQALTSYYRAEKNMKEMEIAVRIADITLLLGPIFESYCAVMRFYEGFSANR